MARKSSYLISGLAAVAAMIVALPAAEGIGAARKEAPPIVQVNRAGKADRLLHPMTVVVRKPAVRAPREPISMREPALPAKPEGKPQKVMDGCEPVFSPVVVPSMAHLAGRCVG
jgi:hypothetical protein